MITQKKKISVRRERFAISLVKTALLAAILLTCVATQAFAAGSISGNVSTSAIPHVPLANTVVQFYDLNGNTEGPTATATTDASGNYTVNLPAGTYGVLTQDTHGYINQIYDNVPCSATCDVNVITPVIVTNSAVTEINFLLDPGGRITGKVTQADGTTPIAGVRVNFVNSEGFLVFTSALTNASGDYISEGGTADGTVYAFTTNTQGYQDELYNNIHYFGGDVTSGTVIAVTQAGGASGINFLLDLGGRITGTVTAVGGAPLANVEVQIADSTGNGVGSTVTDGSGFYSTPGFVAGNYYAFTRNTQGFADELYDNITCPNGNCPLNNGVTTATAIAVGAPGTTASGRNFVLSPGGTIAGTVTNAASGLPIPDVFVGIFTVSNVPGPTFGLVLFLGGAQTNGSGAYSAVLPAGTYFAAVIQQSGYANQIYYSLSCADFNCPVQNGVPINVTTGATTGNINFALVTGSGSISGTVTGGGTAVNGVQVQLFSSTGTLIGSVMTSGSGGGTGGYAFAGLAPGSYYVRTNAIGGGALYINQLHNGVVCLGCNVVTSGGTLVPVTSGGNTVINFALVTGGHISGTITNTAVPPGPLQGVSVQFFNAAGVQVGSNSSNASGVYTSFALPPGTYYVRTAVTAAQNFIDELWNDHPCVPCTVTTGDAVVVSGTGTTMANFALSAGGSISGTVTAAGAPVAGFGILVFNSAAVLVKNTTTDASGNYVVGGLPNGDYFVRTNPGPAQNYVVQMYNGITFNGIPTGTPVTVTVGTPHTGVNFALVSGGSLSGSVKAEGTNAPLGGVFVAVHLPSGRLLRTVTTDALGSFTLSGLPAGTYYVSTNTPALQAPFYVDELYDNMPCLGCGAPGATAFPIVTLPCTPSCAPTVTTGTQVVITNGTTRTGVDFLLASGAGVISGTVMNAAGIGLLNVQVAVYNLAGVLVKSVTSGANTGFYTVRGLPPGTYRARTIVSPATPYYTDVVFGNVPCAPCNVTTTGNDIVVTADTTTTADFVLPAGGSISGAVTDQLTTNPLASVNVELYNAAGNLVKTTFSGIPGNFEFDGLPAGTYFAVARGPAGYLDERYLNMPCTASPGGCVVTAGTPIVVTEGATQGGIAFTLSLAPPTLTLVSPSGARRGSTNLIVGLIGQFTHFVQGTTSASFGAGITVNSTTVLTVTQATANVTIAGGATLGARTVTVATGAEVVALASGFVVGPLTQTRADLDGDSRTDITVYRPSNGTWYVVPSTTGVPYGVAWGNAADKPVVGDFDGDGKTDIAVFRPSNGTWYIVPSATGVPYGYAWGNGADLPVPGDFDGDGRTDIAVFRPSNGTWYVVPSTGAAPYGFAWGNGADLPVPGDYDGDGKTDTAIFRPSTGVWHVMRSSTGTPTALPWGNGADRPVPGDYDGDGKTDIAVFRPSNGTWYVVPSTTGVAYGYAWGNGADIPVPADFDGDGKTDIAVFRPSNGVWYVVPSTGAAPYGFAWGNAADIPIVKRP